jgi:cobalamin biosynthesis Mg chelatase CobN
VLSRLHLPTGHVVNHHRHAVHVHANCHLSILLQVVENRLFSEGLHVLGQPPSQQHMAQYLQAYFDEGLSDEAISAVVERRGDGLEAVRCPCIGCCASHLLESIKHIIHFSLMLCGSHPLLSRDTVVDLRHCACVGVVWTPLWLSHLRRIATSSSRQTGLCALYD